MKNLLFGLIATVLFSLNGNAQEKSSFDNWKKMMDTYNESINSILKEECPKEIELKEFKKNIVEGKSKLSNESIDKIDNLTKPLIDYAVSYATENNLDVSGFSNEEYLVLAGIPPVDGINPQETATGLTANEVWDCVKEACGVGVGGILSVSGLNAIGVNIICKEVSKFLITKLGLGWVGVAIMVAEVSFCLYKEAND